jgi:acyl-CoA synthetase (AMP-forming)/AMP-acid ligase II
MNVADSLSDWADKTPFVAAIVDRDQVIHYRDLDRAVWRAAAWLRDHGVRPGNRVGLSLGRNSPDFLVLFYALARMGAVLMLLPPSEVAANRLAMARRLGLATVIGDDEAARLDGLPLLQPSPDWYRAGPAGAAAGLRVEGGATPCRIGRSSGTTGPPKFIMRAHQDYIRLCTIGCRQVVGAGGRFLTLTAFQFSYGLVHAMQTLHGGGTVRLLQLPVSMDEICAVIDREDITHLAITPTLARDLLRQLSDERPRFPGLRSLVLCTMTAPESLRREIRRRMTPNLVVYYATNETWYLTRADAKAQVEFPETVGFAVDGVDIEIVDDSGQRLAAGEVGLIRIRGHAVPTGYVDDPAASARAFRGGWYYPGDLGTLSPEGALFLKGRVDDMINYDGVKIFPTDIEMALLQHPAVSEAAAFPVIREGYRQIPVAAVVLRGTASRNELIAFCRERLGDRAPSWVFVLPSLPKTATGKVLTRVLAESLRSKSQVVDGRP